MEGEIVPKSDANNDDLEKEMTESLTRGYGPKVARLAMAIVGGAIPLLGGAVSGAAGAWSDGTRPLQQGCGKLAAITER